MTPPRALDRLRPAIWPLLAAAAALVPLAGAFSTTHVFHVRDLVMYFWPRHLWFRETVFNGEWPWWDPYAAAGQSAAADALNQFFLLPVTLVRLALPDVPGFNFWVAAPFPVAAVGAWLWLRRGTSAPAAAVGAAFLTLAGPVVSTANFPNLSWAVACVPWALWSTDRLMQQPGARRFAMLAAWMGMQAIAGEPVTLAATGGLVLAYAALGDVASNWRERASRVIRVGGALAAGALLSSVQMVPLGWAAMRSPRGVDVDAESWALHPLELAETVVAHVFGHSYSGLSHTMPWMNAFHGREPLLVTVYVGLGALALAAVSPRDRRVRRQRAFWWAVCGVALVCALGEYTPVYPALQAAVPVLQSLRFPVKYLVFCAVALAALMATGADALLAPARTHAAMQRPVLPLAVAGAVASIAALFGIGSLISPDAMRGVWQIVGARVPLAIPEEAAGWIVASSPPLLVAVAALGAGVALLIAVVWSGHRASFAAAVALCGLVLLDPLVTNRDANPTMPAAAMGPPEWVSVARRHPGDRVYVGGRVMRPIEPPRSWPRAVDAPVALTSDAELPFMQGNAVLGAEFVYFPAAWHVRESISYDLPQLWPTEYAVMIGMFGRAPLADRLRFVRRTGNRYCFVPEPPGPDATPLTPPNPSTARMALYECETAPRRMYVTSDAAVIPAFRDQLRLLFDAAHDPYAQVMLERDPPAAAGQPGPPAAPDARVRQERTTELRVSASAGADGGYLTVLDTYDPGWRVEVDGDAATLLRANALFRAVRLTPGEHDVRFYYWPVPLYAGLAITLLTAAALLIACWREWLTARQVARRMRQAVTAS